MVSNSINDFHQDYLSVLLEKDGVLIFKTNGVPNLLHIEIKKNPINSTHVKLIGLNEQGIYYLLIEMVTV